MRPRGSVMSQLLVASAVFAVLIAVAAIAGYTAVSQQNQAAKQLTGHYSVLQENDGKLSEAFTRAQIAVLGYALSGDRRFAVPLAPARAEYDSRLTRLRSEAPPGLRRLVDAQARAGAGWWALAPRLLAVRAGTPSARALLGTSTALAGVFYAANIRTQERLHGQVQRLTVSGQESLSTGLAWSAAALGVALLLVLAASLSTLGTVTRPLHRLAATVHRRTAGDHAARAALAGAAEVREVARAVNIQADEADRLRAEEADSNRLRALARAAGIRIREHLVADDVIREARQALATTVGADKVYLHLITDGKLGPPVGEEEGWLLPGEFLTAIPAAGIEDMRQLLRTGASRLIQDPSGPEGDPLPAEMRAGFRQAGIASCLLTPFGVGTELLGLIAVLRLRPGRPWRPAERDAAESIAADLGRGLNHARLYEAENRLVNDLQALDAAKSDFFVTVSHELRAPLTSIEGYLEMLGDEETGPVNAGQRRMLDTVGRSAVRLRHLIDDVFTLSKLESGAFTRGLNPLNIVEAVGGAVTSVEPSAAAAGLTLTQVLPDSAVVVAGEPEQLDRAFVNLLSNAVKFTPPGGRVEVAVTAEQDSAAVRISDTGIGIPERDQRKLFTRFFRSATAVERGIPGTGLGLVIVQTIVAGHNGTVEVSSREGEGTTFTIRIPVWRRGARPGAAASGPSASKG